MWGCTRRLTKLLPLPVGRDRKNTDRVKNQSDRKIDVPSEEEINIDHTQDEIARIRKRKHGRNMLNRSGNTTDNLCFRYRFRDVFSRFRCCVYNGTGPLLRKHNGNMELHVSDTFQKYGNMRFRPVICVNR